MVVADGIPMSLHINGAFCLCVCVWGSSVSDFQVDDDGSYFNVFHFLS